MSKKPNLPEISPAELRENIALDVRNIARPGIFDTQEKVDEEVDRRLAGIEHTKALMHMVALTRIKG